MPYNNHVDTKQNHKTSLGKFRATPAELAAAKELAARSGLTLSELIRRLLKAAVSGEITLRVKQE
mgnify:FL=1